MKKIKIKLTGNDREYSEILLKMLAFKMPSWQLSLTDAGDITLSDDENDVPEIESLPAKLCLREIEDREPEKSGYLYRYSSVSKMIGQIQEIYGKLSGQGQQFSYRRPAKTICFTSGSGGVGLSVVAISVARELAHFHDKRVLFLSLENPSSASVYFRGYNSEDIGCIGDYIYYLFSGRQNHLLDYPEKYIYKDQWGLETLLPAELRNETAELEKEELMRLISAVSAVQKYEYIILDCPSKDPTILSEFRKLLTLIILVEDESYKSIHKCNMLSRFLENDNDDEEENCPLVRVRNRFRDKEIDDEVLSISDDATSFLMEDNGISIDLNKNFGLGVKNLAEKIIQY